MAEKSREKSKEKKPTKKFTPKMQASLLFAFCLIVALFVGLYVRLVDIWASNDGKYERKVLAQQTYVSNAIPYRRGDILDRNGTPLAVSEKVYNLILDPRAMLEKEAYREPTVRALTECFGIEAEEVGAVLEERPDSRYVVMPSGKGLSYDEVSAFQKKEEKDENIVGVWFEEEYVRRYPLKNVASAVIGFTQKGDANIGTWGIEEYYNEELSGTNGREYGYFDGDRNLQRTVKPAQDGHTLISTIDANVQSIVQEKVEKYLDETGAENMAVLIMNPQNGEIYAMASNYSFDLNEPRELTGGYTKKEKKAMSDEEYGEALTRLWKNYCVSDAYEPGSTFKPFTVAAALDEDVASGKSTYECKGKLDVSGVDISCNATHGTVTLKESLMYSCNSAMMRIAKKLGRETFADYLSLYGFGEKTGVDLPGESSGIVYGEDKLNPVELATSSFGQTNTVTMLQMATGFSSLVNGGKYYRPHVVKEIRNANGAVEETVEPVLVRETVSKATSDKIRKYLKDTVEKGTASPAKVKGYEIGGKTGTAEMIPRGNGNYLVSFLGFAPVNEPKAVIYVVIDRPHVKEQDHSSYATEFASDVMKEVLPFLGIYKEDGAGGKAAEK